MSKFKLLLAGISLFAIQNAFASSIKEEKIDLNKAGSISSGKVTNVFKAEDSFFKKYYPQNPTCGTFDAFLKDKSFKTDGRSYEFIGGEELYGSKKTVKNEAKDVILSNCSANKLCVEDAAVDINNKSIFVTYKYDYGPLSSYSYTFAVKTPLDEGDRDEAQLQILLNKYIPGQATRDAFQNLKVGQFCMLDGHDKSIAFVGGKKIYNDHTEIVTNPVDVLPSNLWGNGYRPNHQLVNVDLDLKKGDALMTYSYQPSMWYRGNATHFSFTVVTPLTQEDFISAKLIKTEQRAGKLFDDIVLASERKFLTSEDFSDFVLCTNGTRLYCKKQILNEKMSMDEVKKNFDFCQSKLDIATSPLNLMLNGISVPNIFELARSYPRLNVARDSIDTFAAQTKQ